MAEGRETTMVLLGRIDERLKGLVEDVEELKQGQAAMSLMAPVVKHNIELTDRHESQLAEVGKRVRKLEDDALASATSRKLVIALVTTGVAIGGLLTSIVSYALPH